MKTNPTDRLVVKTGSKISFLIAVAFLLTIQSAPAQSTNPSVARLLNFQDSGRQAHQSFEDSIEKLKRESSRLRSTLDANARPPAIVPRPDLSSKFAPSGTDDIFERIQLLNRILDENQAKQKLQPTDNSAIDTQRLPPPKPAPELDPNTIKQMTKFKEPALGSDPPILPSTPVITGERVVPKPVDAFELGNSLFQTGNIQAALDTYESIDRHELTAFDSKWLDLMIANCQRRLAMWNEANSTYREISNEKHSPHLTESSRWWLKHLEAKAKSKSAYLLMEPEINKLTERARQYVNPK